MKRERSKGLTQGEGTTHSPSIHIVNPPCGGSEWKDTSKRGYRNMYDQRVVLTFGAYHSTLVLAFGHVEDALEDAASWLADNEPGHFATDAVNETYNETYAERIKAGDDEETAIEAAREESEEDCTYTESGWLNSWEWGIARENPTRADLLELMGHEGEAKILRTMAKIKDPLASRKPGNVRKRVEARRPKVA